ncbi:MAG: hypothetical protein IKS83_03845 [Victivallales bacterium]|nr:hypothetical protein [Victivallales bacterium]
MTLTHHNFTTAARREAEALSETFAEWESPRYFLRFDGGFDLTGLFDEEPQQRELLPHPALPDWPNADNEPPLLLYGHCGGVPVLAHAGGWRTADGHGVLPALFPAAVAHAAGARNAIFFDCALSLNPDLKAGRWAMLTDFINGYAFSPLDGLHRDLERPFPNLSEALSQFQNSEIINALGAMGETPMLCTYLGRPGFHLATPAEAAVAHAQGADLVGHDLVLQLIFASAMAFRTSGMVLAGAQFLPGADVSRLTRQDFQEAAKFRSRQLMRTLRQAIAELERPSPEETAALKNSPSPDANADEPPDADEAIYQSIRRAATRTSPLSAFLKRQ